jgi:hypothetical protein
VAHQGERALRTYLNDHLGGSVGALELLEHLEEKHAGTSLERFFADLRADVAQDARELEALMERLAVAQDPMRKAAGWISEKITQLKLRVDDSAGGEFRLLQSLETLTLGIEGKRSLWATLAAAAAGEPLLRGPDYARLAQRAEEQKARVEGQRIAAARIALVGKR